MSVTSKPMRWSAEQMRSLPPIPFNRDVGRHAKQWIASGTLDPTSRAYGANFATVFVRETGEEYCLNGNTRRRMEAEHSIPLPKHCDGEAYVCDTMAEAKDLYDKIDNSRPIKQAVDRLFTTFQYLHIPVRSPLFVGGHGTSGIAVAYHALCGRESNECGDINAIIEPQKDAVLATDEVFVKCGVKSNRVATHTAVIAAMLMSFRKTLFGEPKPAKQELLKGEWAEFWSDFHKSKGTLLGTGTSPYNKAWAAVQGNKSGRSQRQAVFLLTGKLLDCFERREETRVINVTNRSLKTYCPIQSWVEGIHVTVADQVRVEISIVEQVRMEVLGLMKHGDVKLDRAYQFAKAHGCSGDSVEGSIRRDVFQRPVEKGWMERVASATYRLTPAGRKNYFGSVGASHS